MGYSWVIHLKNKKGITIANAFRKNFTSLIANQIKCG